MLFRSIAKVSLLAAVVAARSTEGIAQNDDNSVDLKITTNVDGDKVSSSVDLKRTNDDKSDSNSKNTSENKTSEKSEDATDSSCLDTNAKIADCSLATVISTAVIALTIGYFCNTGCSDCKCEGDDDSTEVNKDNEVSDVSDVSSEKEKKDSIIPTSDAAAEMIEKLVDLVVDTKTGDSEAKKDSASDSSSSNLATIVVSVLAACVVLLAVLLAMARSKKAGVQRVNSGHDMLTGSKAKDGVVATNANYHEFLEEEEEADMREGLIVQDEV